MGVSIPGLSKTPLVIATQPTTTRQRVVVADRERIFLFLQNIGAEPVYLGLDNTVTAANAIIILDSGQWIADELTAGDELWGIMVTGTADLRGYEVVRS